MKKATFLILFAFLSLNLAFAQLTLSPSGANQKSVATQYIGSLAHVTITYNSPDVTAPNGQDRTGKIWGQLVPYGLTDLGFGLRNPSPWRAGANENTTIEFSHDMTVQGKPIKAGKYGLHIIVEEEGPWTLIFSNNSSSWGSFFYDEKEDALQVKATPEKNEFHEWLSYEFTDRQPDNCTAALMWENISLTFKIEVPDANELYVSNLREELRSSKGFTWTNWNAAANFCLQNDYNLEEGLQWAEAAISSPFLGNENFSTLQTKGGILAKLNRQDEAGEAMDKAIKHPTATSFQIHGYGRQLIGLGQKEKALEVFKYNYERFDKAWPTEVGMARGYSATGQYDKALEHAKIAVGQAPDKLNKDGMTAAIEKLKKGEDIN